MRAALADADRTAADRWDTGRKVAVPPLHEHATGLSQRPIPPHSGAHAAFPPAPFAELYAVSLWIVKEVY